jgi:hypothetical protein
VRCVRVGGGTKLCTEGKENESVDIHHPSLVRLHFRDSVISGALHSEGVDWQDGVQRNDQTRMSSITHCC